MKCIRHNFVRLALVLVFLSAFNSMIDAQTKAAPEVLNEAAAAKIVQSDVQH